MKTITQATIDLKTVPTVSQNIIAAQLFHCVSKAFENEEVQRQYREWKKAKKSRRQNDKAGIVHMEHPDPDRDQVGSFGRIGLSADE